MLTGWDGFVEWIWHCIAGSHLEGGGILFVKWMCGKGTYATGIWVRVVRWLRKIIPPTKKKRVRSTTSSRPPLEVYVLFDRAVESFFIII